MKIVPISKNIAITFAGDVNLAFDIIKHIKEVYATDQQDIKQVLLSVQNSFWPLPKDNEGHKPYVAIIVGSNCENKSQLLKWDTSKPNHVESDSDFYAIGYLPDNYDIKIKNMLKSLITKDYSNNDLLTGIIVTLQIYAMKDKLIQSYVGGYFCGIQINNQGIFWQKDITYILFEGKSDPNYFIVTCIARKNIVIVLSTKEKIVCAYINTVNSLPNEDAIREIQNTCFEIYSKGIAKYLVFIATNTFNAAIVKQSDGKSDDQYYSINIDVKKFEIKPILMKFLFDSANSPRLTVIN